MNYIIDGYNLAFKIREISQNIKTGATELAIKQVVQFVKAGLKSTQSKIVIVFDGKDNNQPSKSNYSGINLWFSKKPRTADDIIRDFIRETKNIDKWTVISSDNEILYTAKDHGANTMSSNDFIQMKNQLQQRQQNSTGTYNKHNPQNIDVEYWRKIFNSGNNS